MACPDNPLKILGIPIGGHDQRIHRIVLSSWWTVYSRCSYCGALRVRFNVEDEELVRLGFDVRKLREHTPVAGPFIAECRRVS